MHMLTAVPCQTSTKYLMFEMVSPSFFFFRSKLGIGRAYGLLKILYSS